MTDDAWREEFRRRALALEKMLDEVIADVPLPAEVQETVDRCREDLAVVRAATDDATATLLAMGLVTNFDALRGLLRKH